MEKYKLNEADFELIKAAQSEFEQSRKHDWHGVAAAVRLTSGEIITAMVLEAENPSLTICAEPIVIGKALGHLKDYDIECVVAVRSAEKTAHKVIPPCGRCREFITDYSDDAKVIIYDTETQDLFKVRAKILLPFKYRNSPS